LALSQSAAYAGIGLFTAVFKHQIVAFLSALFIGSFFISFSIIIRQYESLPGRSQQSQYDVISMLSEACGSEDLVISSISFFGLFLYRGSLAEKCLQLMFNEKNLI
jgi:hypothetical protein